MIQETIDIDRRPEEVYSYVTDPSHLPEWQESAVSSRELADEPLGVGSTFEVTRHLGRRTFPTTMEVTEFDPPRSWRSRGVDGPVRPAVHGTVAPLDDGSRSRLTLELDFEAHGMGKLLVPLVVKPHARRETPKNERKLKDVLEHQAA